MPDKPGAQFHDHPNMVAGRAALPRLLADFVDYEFGVQCPTPPCRFRRFPVAPIVAARQDVTVGEALSRLRCGDCGEAPEIVLLVKDSLSAGAESLALRIEADAWKPLIPNAADRNLSRRRRASGRMAAAPSGAQPSRPMPAPAIEAVIGHDHRDLV